jgi:hypothetical protein
MKKTLLIITLFIGLGNVNAQSDANYQETLDWLRYYGLKGNSKVTQGNEYFSEWWLAGSTGKSEAFFTIKKENKIDFRYRNILSVTLKKSKTLENGYDVIIVYKENEQHQVYTSFKDKEQAQSLYNAEAFKHFY